MTNNKKPQLNPFEIKSEISRIYKALEHTTVVIDTKEFELLDAQDDYKTITKLLFKEFLLENEETLPIIKLLLIRYADDTNELIEELEKIIKSTKYNNNIKLHAIEVISNVKPDWQSMGYDEYLEYNEELIQQETKELLETATFNPEIQLDFLDFLNAIPPKDQILLIESLKEDQHAGDMANILVPIFLSFPKTEIGLTALKMIGTTRSTYAYKALSQAIDFFNETTKSLIKKCLTELKLSGACFSNATYNYENSEFYMIAPDGEGNVSLIYKEKNADDTTRLIGIVFDDYTGIRDCLGFNAISEFEATFLIEKLIGSDTKTEISANTFKTLLNNAEKLNYKTSTPPYEYNCWKQIFVDLTPDNLNLTEFLDKNISNEKINIVTVTNLFNSDFTTTWFYTHTFGDETEAFFQDLDNQLKETSIENIDIDNFINKNINNIFYETEKENWINRLHLTAYCRYISGDKEVANTIYQITLSNEWMNLLYNFIIKQSIFQYFLKMLADKYFLKYPQKKIEEILSYLENLWGFYV